MRKRFFVLAILGTAALGVVIPGPAGASRFGPSGPPSDFYHSYPFEDRLGSGGPALYVQDSLNPHKWVWTVDPTVYGATGTVTFYDYANAIQAYKAGLPATGFNAMQGPGGVGVNDWRVCVGLAADRCHPGQSPFDFNRPSFTQEVEVVPQDYLTPDPPSNIHSDWDPTLFFTARDGADVAPHPFDGASGAYPNANMDGSANLYKFAYTIAPGTQFMNMQVDRSGNYYVARRDMQWDWIDHFNYKPYGEDPSIPPTVVDTQFKIQPYPISDGYGWCGAVPPEDPNSISGMAGQLTKDIAFDVYSGAGAMGQFASRPDTGRPPLTTEIVPSFQMRSYGVWIVDVTMLSSGARQQFVGIAKGVHYRPVDVTINGVTYKAGTQVQPNDPDFQRWFNHVKPFAAGVIPKGAWVINDGNSRYMQVVPAGTPGAVWHQNKFAGAAFMVRGDMERRVNYVNAASNWASDQGTTSTYNEVYYNLIQSGAINPATGKPWKRSDWTDWAVGGQTLLPDAH